MIRFSAPRDQVGIAGDRAGAGQRHVLPGPGFLRLVAGKGIDVGRDRPGIAGGPQAEVDLVEAALRGRRRKRREQALRQPGEIEAAGQRPRAVGGGRIVGEIVEEHEVEVGGGGHLAAAELAHGDQRHPAAASCGHARASNSRRAAARSAAAITSASSAKARPAWRAPIVPASTRTPIRKVCSWPKMRARSRTSS